MIIQGPGPSSLTFRILWMMALDDAKNKQSVLVTIQGPSMLLSRCVSRRISRRVSRSFSTSLSRRVSRSFSRRVWRLVSRRFETRLETRLETRRETRLKKHLKQLLETRLETRLEICLETRLEKSKDGPWMVGMTLCLYFSHHPRPSSKGSEMTRMMALSLGWSSLHP